jgi:hypothetical protein
VNERRHFAHRIDRKVIRRLHRRAEVEKLAAIGLAHLFEHPADDTAARHRIGIEDKLVHQMVAPCVQSETEEADQAGFSQTRLS